MIPTIVEKNNIYDIYSRLLKDRIIFVGGPQGEIGTEIANIIIAQLLYFLFTMPKTKKQNSFNFDKKTYFKLCGLSFIETLTRNLTYYFIILVLLNSLNNQDLYFISNDFIWSIMLIPTMAQNNFVKQNLSQNNNESLKPYFVNKNLGVPFWNPFFRAVLFRQLADIGEDTAIDIEHMSVDSI